MLKLLDYCLANSLLTALQNRSIYSRSNLDNLRSYVFSLAEKRLASISNFSFFFQLKEVIKLISNKLIKLKINEFLPAVIRSGNTPVVAGQNLVL